MNDLLQILLAAVPAAVRTLVTSRCWNGSDTFICSQQSDLSADFILAKLQRS